MNVRMKRMDRTKRRWDSRSSSSIKRNATVTKFRTGRSWCIKIIRNSGPSTSRDWPRYRFRTNNLSKINHFLGCVFTHASF